MVALPYTPVGKANNNFERPSSLLRQLTLSRRTLFTIGLLSVMILLLSSSSALSALTPAGQDGQLLETHFYSTKVGSFIKQYSWTSTREPANMTEFICPECDCSKPGFYSLSPRFTSPLPCASDIRQATATKRTLKRFLMSEIQHYMWLHPVYIPPDALAPLFQNFFTCPDNLISLNFGGLDFDKPTTYMYTRTGDGGRLKANERRLRYFRRHADTLKDFNLIVREKGYLDGAKAEDRQLIWILIEDGHHIDQDLATLLNSTGLPYLYFAHGPTHYYGNAQWNAAERAVHVLRDNLFGDGPVFNVDDDSKILPDLLRRIWKVKKLVMWQVGNFGAKGWEGPVFKKGKLVSWDIAGLPSRKFPIDMGGFAYNSSVIGDGRLVSPPSYLPENHYGGESEFVAQIIKSREEIEPLCDNTIEEKCRFSWHNWIEDDESKNTVP